MTKADEIKVAQSVARMEGTLTGMHEHLAAISKIQQDELKGQRALEIKSEMNESRSMLNRRFLVWMFITFTSLLSATFVAILTNKISVGGTVPPRITPVSTGVVK